MEQIRSGQSFLYRENGYSSTVIEINMKDKVRGDYLQVAYSNALKRFPYLSYKLVEKDAKYYLCEDVISMTVNKTKKFRTLGSMQTGYHLLDITYINKSIRVAFHHGLCDGRGIKPFIETLMYYYCTLKYNKKFDATGIHLTNEEIDKEEMHEPFDDKIFEYDESKVFKLDIEPFSIPENTLDTSQSFRTEVIVNQEEFIKCVKKYKATPTVFTSILFSKGILKNNPGIKKDIVSNIAIDLRSFVGMDKTHKNCTGTIYLPYSKKDETILVEDLSVRFKELLKNQRSVDTIKFSLTKQIMMFNKLDDMKTLEEKRKTLGFFNTLSNDTYVISYLGQMQFNDFGKYVDYTSFYSERNRGIIINMVASSDDICFNIMQNFEDSKYVDAFIKNLDEYNIPYRVNRVGEFNTGKDKGYITASHQSERY